jgi:hypothetical protein
VKAARKLKAVFGASCPRKVIEPESFIKMRPKKFHCPLGDSRCRADRLESIPFQVLAQQPCNPVSALLNGKPRRRQKNGLTGLGNGICQHPILGQCFPEADTAIAIAHVTPDPGLRQVEHAVGEALGSDCLPIVPFFGFNENDFPWGALSPLAPAEKVLHTLMCDAYQPFVMKVHIVGMAMKTCCYRLQSGSLIAFQMQEIAPMIQGLAHIFHTASDGEPGDDAR